MIGVALIIFVGIGVISMVALVLIRSASLDHEATRTRLHEVSADTLAYDVPNGQDPVELILALSKAGYTAIEELGGGRRQLLVACPGSQTAARPRVRAVLQEHCASEVAAVRFVDEE
jgi:hypothetical protein